MYTKFHWTLFFLLFAALSLSAQESTPVSFDMFDNYAAFARENSDQPIWDLEPWNPRWVDQRFFAQGPDSSLDSSPAVLYYQIQDSNPKALGIIQKENDEVIFYYDFTENFNLVEKSSKLMAPFFAYRKEDIPRGTMSADHELFEIYWQILNSEDGPFVSSVGMQTLMDELDVYATDPTLPNRDLVYSLYYYLECGELFSLEAFGATGFIIEQYQAGRISGDSPPVGILYAFIRSSVEAGHTDLIIKALMLMSQTMPDFIPIQAVWYSIMTDNEYRAQVKEELLRHPENWAVRELEFGS